jgi:hypothetical protein
MSACTNILSFQLPYDAVSNFAAMFTELESEDAKSRLGVGAYGISITTLEEVFLKVRHEL